MSIESKLAKLATEATSHRAYREGALALLREVVPFDGALMHALSPRVPLETAVIVGIDPQRIAQTMPGWDAIAVELGRLRDLANEKRFRRGARCVRASTNWHSSPSARSRLSSCTSSCAVRFTAP